MNSFSLNPGLADVAGFALGGMAGRAPAMGERSTGAGVAEANSCGAGAFSTGFGSASGRVFAAAGGTAAAGICTSLAFTAGLAGTAALAGFAAVLAGATGLLSGVFTLALTFSTAVLEALAATARFAGLLTAPAVFVPAFAVDLAAAGALRALVAVRRVGAAARAAGLAVSFAGDLDFVVALEVIVPVILADVFALVLRLDAAAARARLAVGGEAAPADRFAVELLAAAAFVARLLPAGLEDDFERASDPLARVSAAEAVAGAFFLGLFLEGIRELLLYCPAVETGSIAA